MNRLDFPRSKIHDVGCFPMGFVAAPEHELRANDCDVFNSVQSGPRGDMVRMPVVRLPRSAILECERGADCADTETAPFRYTIDAVAWCPFRSVPCVSKGPIPRFDALRRQGAGTTCRFC